MSLDPDLYSGTGLIMPKTIFDEKETLASGEGVINASGNIYIDNGRKYIGKRVRWVILKDEGASSIARQ